MTHDPSGLQKPSCLFFLPLTFPRTSAWNAEAIPSPEVPVAADRIQMKYRYGDAKWCSVIHNYFSGIRGLLWTGLAGFKSQMLTDLVTRAVGDCS